MTGKPGEVLDGELWIRCFSCGDSMNHPDKAHYSVNIRTGLFHCYRCGVSGKLAFPELLDILERLDYDLEDLSIFHSIEENGSDPLDDLPPVEPGAGSPRKSMLERWHLTHNGVVWDAFQMRSTSGDLTGVVLRRPGQSIAFGSKNLGWVGEDFPRSSTLTPIRVVEGPYDVLEANDVCVFGTISQSSINALAGHFVTITPDGDIWQRIELFRPFANMIEKTLMSGKVLIVSLEAIEEGKDPDEVPPEDRIIISRREIRPFFREIRRKHGLPDIRRTRGVWKKYFS